METSRIEELRNKPLTCLLADNQLKVLSHSRHDQPHFPAKPAYRTFHASLVLIGQTQQGNKLSSHETCGIMKSVHWSGCLKTHLWQTKHLKTWHQARAETYSAENCCRIPRLLVTQITQLAKLENIQCKLEIENTHLQSKLCASPLQLTCFKKG